MSQVRMTIPSNSLTPFVGRGSERSRLQAAMEEAKKGKGSTWVLEGPGGIGKTRLARWLAEEAPKVGFRVRWGYCLKKSLAVFFPWEQVFRHEPSATDLGSAPSADGEGKAEQLPPVLLLEDAREKALRGIVSRLGADRKCLLLSRDRPSMVREKNPGMSQTTRILWLSRVEGADNIAPGSVDTLGELVEKHLRSERGSLAALEGIEYLVSQSSFPSVLSLLQFLRDVAQETDGHILISLRTSSFEKREVSLLESLGDVDRGTDTSTPAKEKPTVSGVSLEPPETVMMRYLERLEQDVGHQPQMVIIDDLHWADPHSLRVFQFLSRNTRTLPVLLVATMRDDEGPSDGDYTETPLNEVLDAMRLEGLFVNLPVTRIADEEVRQLADSVLGAPLGSSPMEDELLRRVDGNPYFLLATLEMLSEQGRLVKKGGNVAISTNGSQGWDLPESVKRTVTRRLSLLAPAERELLGTAAIIGKEFDLVTLSAVLKKEPVLMRSDLRTLELEKRFLHRMTGGMDRWAFTDALTWEVVVQENIPDMVVDTARFLGDWWADCRPEEPSETARFYFMAHESRKGLPWVRSAIEEATSEHSSSLVEQLNGWMQEMLKDTGVSPSQRVDEGADVLVRLIEVTGAGSATAERMARNLVGLKAPGNSQLKAEILLHAVLAMRNPAEARTLDGPIKKRLEGSAGVLSPTIAVYWVRSRTYLHIISGEYDKALSIVREGLELLESDVPPILMASMLSSAGSILSSTGHSDEAALVVTRLNNLAHRTGLPKVWSYLISLMAELAWLDGRLGEAASLSKDWANTSKACGDVGNCNIALENAANFLIFSGHLDQAESMLAEGAEIAKHFDLLPRLSSMRGLKGLLLAHRGRWKEALNTWEEADEMGGRIGYAEHHLEYMVFSALARSHLGNAADAIKTLATLEEGLASLPEVLKADLFLARAFVLVSLGQVKEAGQTLHQAFDVAHNLRHPFYEARVLSLLSTWEELHGDPSESGRLKAESNSLFDHCGVIENARRFYSEWPESPPP